MSLRAKFLILIFGSVIAPVVVFLISYRLGTDISTLREHRGFFKANHEWRKELGGRILDADDIGGSLGEHPMFVELRVFDGNGTLLYGECPEPFDGEDNQLFFTRTIPVNMTSGTDGLIVATWNASPFMQNEDRWYVPLTGLLFLAVMAIVIGQSINRSIGNLEKATRRIADGDLDFELPIKGNDKLASFTRSFDSMRAHLKEEYARRARFIMGISHDLKTPLSSISGYVDAIKDGYADTSEKMEKYVDIISDKADLLESRISMLIDYVKRDTADWMVNLQLVDMGPLLEEIATVFESEAVLNRRTITSTIDVGTETWVPMDEDMFIRAMENLLQNALRYSPEGSEIVLRCNKGVEGVIISLSNEGDGIHREDLPYVFDPFVRGAKDRRGGGLGLGLATVESIITSHGWGIAVDSDPDTCTVFTITIPLEKRRDTPHA